MIREEGWSLATSDLYSSQTVKQLAETIVFDGDAEFLEIPQNVSVVQMNSSSEPVNIFCLPPGGGLAGVYQHLADGLSVIGKFYGLQIPSQFMSRESISYQDIVEYFHKLIKTLQPTGPYYLIGWSLGGRLAYEIACEMEFEREEVAYVGLLDALPIIESPAEFVWYRKIRELIEKKGPVIDWAYIDKLTKDKAMQYILDLVSQSNFRPSSISLDQIKTYFEFLANMEKAKYEYRTRSSNLKVDLYRAKMAEAHQVNDDPYRLDLCELWNVVAGGGMEIVFVEGAHTTMVKPPHVDSLIYQIIKRMGSSIDALARD